MSDRPIGPVTELLNAAGAGDARAAAELLPLVYEELRKLAQARMAKTPPGNTLQPTALVHEAYLRLIGNEATAFNSRGHFFGAAARAMRQILVEQARRKAARKHGGGRHKLDLDEVEPAFAPDDLTDVLALDAALNRLEETDARKASVVMLRYFAGLSAEETAAAVGVSVPTVERDWRFARAFLFTQLNPAAPADAPSTESPKRGSGESQQS